MDHTWKRLAVAAGAAILLAASVLPVGACVVPAATHGLATDTRFYVSRPQPGAREQINALTRARHLKDAYLIRRMILTPQTVWFTGGTPAEVEKSVRRTVNAAARSGRVPILVAYNVPYRDCSQYSAGGAVDTAAYKAWIDGLAAGIGGHKVVVIVEPDGLGIIPYYKPLYSPMEWCQPKDGNGNPAPEADPAHRFEQINYAVDVLEALPGTSVYLDGTHSGWLGVGDMADRLIQAGVKKAQGFFTNVSNYRTTETSIIYGTWVSECIARTDKDSWWNPNWCPGQYSPPTYQVDYSEAWVANVNAQYASWGVSPTVHFVIDTSRNGQGPWTPPADHPSGDPQDWCNPPDRGLGLRPTADTGVALLDAYLWIKIPGASDGQCTRWADPGAGIDPVRGYADPAAGVWFPEMALELVRNANPPLKLPRGLK